MCTCVHACAIQEDVWERLCGPEKRQFEMMRPLEVSTGNGVEEQGAPTALWWEPTPQVLQAGAATPAQAEAWPSARPGVCPGAGGETRGEHSDSRVTAPSRDCDSVHRLRGREGQPGTSVLMRVGASRGRALAHRLRQVPACAGRAGAAPRGTNTPRNPRGRGPGTPRGQRSAGLSGRLRAQGRRRGRAYAAAPQGPRSGSLGMVLWRGGRQGGGTRGVPGSQLSRENKVLAGGVTRTPRCGPRQLPRTQRSARTTPKRLPAGWRRGRTRGLTGDSGFKGTGGRGLSGRWCAAVTAWGTCVCDSV